MQVRASLLSFLWFLLLGITSPVYAIGTVTVLADSSMNLAMADLARDYSKYRQVVVNVSLATESAQETQIAEGGSADILITPKQSWIETLKTKGLMDVHSQTVVADNQLVLVGPQDSTFRASISKTFPTAAVISQIEGEQAFVIGNPATQSSGAYAKEALRKLGAADDLEPYTLYVKNFDQMLDMVRQSHAFGVFFSSMVQGVDGVQVMDVFPKSSHRPITYYGVAIAGDNMDEARQFLAYLKSPSAKKILTKNGFVTN